eukprot:Skav231788  [mRNA]  locus=scaffold734:4475:5497:- [translate_table: standard]
MKRELETVKSENSILKSENETLQKENGKLRRLLVEKSEHTVSGGQGQGDEQNNQDDEDDRDDDDDDQGDSDGGDSDGGGIDFEDETFITVNVKQSWSDKTIRCVVQPSWKLNSLKILISNKWRIPLCEQTFSLTGGGFLWGNLSFRENGIKDEQTIQLKLTIRGGASDRKRGRTATTDKEQRNIKDVKQSVVDLMKRLETSTSPVIKNCVDRAKYIMDTAKSNPGNISNVLLNHLKIDVLKQMASGVMTCSTHISTRVRFVAELALEDEFASINDLTNQVSLTDKLICDAVQFGIMSQFADVSGNTIQWTPLNKCLTDLIGNANANRENQDAPNRACVIS